MRLVKGGNEPVENRAERTSAQLSHEWLPALPLRDWRFSNEIIDGALLLEGYPSPVVYSALHRYVRNDDLHSSALEPG